MEIIIGEKFTSKDLDRIISTYLSKSINSPKSDKITFHLTALSWIALEELNFLFGWIRFLITNEKNVFVKLPSLNPNNKRVFRRAVSLWHRWKIHSIIPFNNSLGRHEYYKYFDVPSSINTLIQNEIEKDRLRQELNDQNWHKVIPFHFINADYRDDITLLRETLKKEVDGIFKIEKEIELLLNKETCYSPFQNKTLSRIITTELYLNVIHHSFDTNIQTVKECYLSIALNNARDFEKYIERKKNRGISLTIPEAKLEIQDQLAKNLKREKSNEEVEFYLTAEGLARNESFIEFSFLDFGKGIVNTLNEKFERDIKKKEIQIQLKSFNEKKEIHTQIIEYAFLLQSSRNEFKTNIALQNYVPRGLFFLVDLVKRYKGMLIARSGKGKIIYDFKEFQVNDKERVRNSEFVRFVSDESQIGELQGTLYTIIIPAQKEISINAIEGESKLVARNIVSRPFRYIDINEIFQNTLRSHKGVITIHDMYDYIFVAMNDVLKDYIDEKCILIFDFQHVDNSVVDMKLYYFLCHHPLINESCNAIIVNPPDKSIIRDVQASLSVQDIHLLRPIPCVISSKDIVWLGLKNTFDEKLLNEYWLFDVKPTLAASDFSNFKSKDYEKLRGNVIQFDKFGNMEFSIPNFSEFWHYLRVEMPSQDLLNLLLNSKENVLLGESSKK